MTGPATCRRSPRASDGLEVQRPVRAGHLAVVVVADEDHLAAEVDARRDPMPSAIVDLAAAAFVGAHRRADVRPCARTHRAGWTAARAADRRETTSPATWARPVAHLSDRTGDGASSRARQPRRRRRRAIASKNPRHQPAGRHPWTVLGDHPERMRARRRSVRRRPATPAGDLTRGEQAERELADPPAEPDRRLADADDAERDLPDRDQARRRPGRPRSRPTAGRPPPAGRVDAANDVHQRRPRLEPRPVLEARRCVIRRHEPPRLSAPNRPAQPCKSVRPRRPAATRSASVDVQCLGRARRVCCVLVIGAAAGAHCGATSRRRRRAEATAARGAGAGTGWHARRAATSCARTTPARRCARCHAEIHAAWRGSPMHRMTRLPGGAEIRAPFDGATFPVQGRHGAARRAARGARYMRSSRRAQTATTSTASPVIGGRYREDFAGVEVGAVGAADRRRRAELVLPVSYVFETRQFRFKGYSVMVSERPGLRAGGVWNQTCIFCHNTVPVLRRAVGRAARAGRARLPGRGRSIALLPRDRRWRSRSTRRAALREALAAEVAAVAGHAARATAARSPRRARRRHRATLRSRFGAPHLVEVGIGCEACHGGSREHVAHPRVLPDFEPRSRVPAARPAAGRRPPTRAERSTASARAATRCCSRATRAPGRGGSAGRQAGRQLASTRARRATSCSAAARAQMACTDLPRSRTARIAAPKLDRLGDRRRQRASARLPRAVRGAAGAGGARPPRSRRRGRRAASPATCRRRTWGSATRSPATTASARRPIRRASSAIGRSSARSATPTRPSASWSATMERGGGSSTTARRCASSTATLRGPAAGGDAGARQAARAGGGGRRAGRGASHQAVPAVARQLVNPYPLVRYYARRRSTRCAATCPVDLDRPTAEIVARRSAPASPRRSPSMAGGDADSSTAAARRRRPHDED